MIRNKFKKLIALASSVAIVSSFMVPVTHAASGEVYYDENFDSLEEKVLVKVSSDSSQSYTGEGFEMQCGSRSSADGNAFEIAYSGGKLAAAKERYSDADRYGRIYLQNVPADADLLYSSFDFSVTKAEGIVISDIDNVALMSGGENTETLGVGTLGGIESGKE